MTFVRSRQSQLSGNVASNLQNQINEVKREVENVDNTIRSDMPNIIEPIGTVKTTIRTDLGPEWHLCNGDSYEQQDVSQEYWNLANDPKIIENGALATKIANGDISSVQNVSKIYILRVLSDTATNTQAIGVLRSNQIELYGTEDSGRTFRKIHVPSQSSSHYNWLYVIHWKGSWNVYNVYTRKRYLLADDNLYSENYTESTSTNSHFQGSNIRGYNFAVTPRGIYILLITGSDNDELNIVYAPDPFSGNCTSVETYSDIPYTKMDYIPEDDVLLIYGPGGSNNYTYMCVSTINESTKRVSVPINHLANSNGPADNIKRVAANKYLIFDSTGKAILVQCNSSTKVLTLVTLGTTGNYYINLNIGQGALQGISKEPLSNGKYVMVYASAILFSDLDVSKTFSYIANINAKISSYRTNRTNSYGLPWLPYASGETFVVDSYVVSNKVTSVISPLNVYPTISTNGAYNYIKTKESGAL